MVTDDDYGQDEWADHAGPPVMPEETGAMREGPRNLGECPTCHSTVEVTHTDHRQSTIVGWERWTETHYTALTFTAVAPQELLAYGAEPPEYPGMVLVPRDVLARTQQALRVAAHRPHDPSGEPIEGFPVCVVCGAILTEYASLDLFRDRVSGDGEFQRGWRSAIDAIAEALDDGLGDPR